MIGREIFLGAMKFNAAAFGSSFLFIYWFCMNHTRTIIHMCLDSVPLPLVCAPDFIFGFLLRQANFHMDYLLHEIYCSHYFCCLFSSGFLRAEFVQVHTEYWIHIGLCATGMWPMHWIYMWTDLLFFFWFLHSTQLRFRFQFIVFERHICTIVGNSILDRVWVLFLFSLNTIVVPWLCSTFERQIAIQLFQCHFFGGIHTEEIMFTHSAVVDPPYCWAGIVTSRMETSKSILIYSIVRKCLCALRHPICFSLVR